MKLQTSKFLNLYVDISSTIDTTQASLSMRPCTVGVGGTTVWVQFDDGQVWILQNLVYGNHGHNGLLVSYVHRIILYC